MILVDTNVWITFFRQGLPALELMLDEGEVMIHPLIIGELGMGCLPMRLGTLDDLQRLPRADEASWEEVRRMVEARKLWGRGLQWNDVCLLASAILTGVPLWTADARLATAATEAGVGFNR